MGRPGTCYLYECFAGVRPDRSGVTSPIDVIIRGDAFVPDGRPIGPLLTPGQAGALDYFA